MSSISSLISFQQPHEALIAAFLTTHTTGSYSYAEVGASRQSPPAGYAIDHHRVRLGSGEASFRAACAALRAWKMFQLGWVSIQPSNTAVQQGQIVAVMAQVFGVWFLNACQIVTVWEETGEVERLGFAYGTLEAHMERGEERFCVEWNHADDSVWYDLFAFSQPNHLLSRIGYPVARWIQHRFAEASLAAMTRAVRAGQGEDEWTQDADRPQIGQVQIVCRKTDLAELTRWVVSVGSGIGLLGVGVRWLM